MLSQEEKAELESLKKDPEKKKLYQYRWLRKKGKKIAEALEAELADDDEDDNDE